MSEFSDDQLDGTIDVLPGQELIYTSIPYDKGWKVTADGKEIETFEILGGLIAFRLDAGSYDLKMEYRPDCIVYGSMISAGAVVLFILICVGDMIIRKRRRLRETLAGRDKESDGAELGIADLALSGKRTYAHDLPKKKDRRPISSGIAAELESEIRSSDGEQDIVLEAEPEEEPPEIDIPGDAESADSAGKEAGSEGGEAK